MSEDSQRPRYRQPSKVARFKVKGGDKSVVVGGRESIRAGMDIKKIRVNGKRFDGSIEQIGKAGYNLYSKGTVIKLRDRPGKRSRISVTNTNGKLVRVGVRYRYSRP